MFRSGAPGRLVWVAIAAAICLTWRTTQGQLKTADQNRLWQHRNLGKAFYENPTTQAQAVGEFRKALDLAPGSTRERLNYGLALLRAGDVERGIAELVQVQKLDPAIPHTWFNLGIAYKKAGDFEPALAQFQRMARLVPNEPVTHYQLGALYKLRGDLPAAAKEFETARELDPRLAAPHFQLFGLYRQLDRAADSAAELKLFQELKKAQEGAAVPEDMEWSFYAEIYDPIDGAPTASPTAPVYRQEKLADGFGPSGGTAVLTLDGGGHPSLVAWSTERVVVFRDGKTPMRDSGLEGLRGVVSIAPGDFDNDGLADVCVITAQGAALYRNVDGHFRKQADLATGAFRKAVWLDYDHDYDLDLFLIGDESKLLRNNGTAGFSDESKRFPFVAGQALDAVRFDLEPDTPGFDLVLSYADRTGILYRDRLGGAYEAVALDDLPKGAINLAAADLDHDGRTDLAATLPDGPNLLLGNRGGKFQRAAVPNTLANADEFAFLPAADFAGKGRADRALLARDGTLYVKRDVTPNYGNWLEIGLIGVKSLKQAVGAKIEVKAGTVYRKLTYEGVPVVVRLGSHATVDTVRITWPNGLIQNEINQAANRVVVYKEAPRLSGSCPMIFTWNGERFEFITDVLGVAPLGASSGDGEFFPVDHDEYVTIPGASLKARDGNYEIRVTEELREVSYLDQIQLLALDHPAEIDIVTNEKFKSPPFPEFRLFGVDRRIYPVTARDHR